MAQGKATAQVQQQILCGIRLGKLMRWESVEGQTIASVHRESGRVCGEALEMQVDVLF